MIQPVIVSTKFQLHSNFLRRVFCLWLLTLGCPLRLMPPIVMAIIRDTASQIWMWYILSMFSGLRIIWILFLEFMCIFHRAATNLIISGNYFSFNFLFGCSTKCQKIMKNVISNFSQRNAPHLLLLGLWWKQCVSEMLPIVLNHLLFTQKKCF